MTAKITQESLNDLLLQMELDQKAIHECFTNEETVADQVVMACKKLMDFVSVYGLDKQAVKDTYPMQGEARRLEREYRAGRIEDDEYQVESRKIIDRVFDLANEVQTKAEVLLTQRDASSVIEHAVATTTQVTKQVPLHEAAIVFAETRTSDHVVFRCEDLCKIYSSKASFGLENVKLELRKGEVTGLLGVNGSGKSTLLRIIAGALLASGGKREYPALKCRPNDWVKIRRSIAFVEQRPEKWPGTVLEALIRQAACFGMCSAAGRDEVDFILSRLGLEEYADKTWDMLSGGYRTRVELAKAILSNPAMLILDEPLAPLDIPAQLEFLDDLRSIASRGVGTLTKSPLPVILSSQHVFEVEAIADQILVLDDGKVRYSGPANHVGVGRRQNWFELKCNLNADELARAMTSYKVKRIHLTGGSTYLITTDTSVTSDLIVQGLQRAGVPVTLFRDASCSARRFFEL